MGKITDRIGEISYNNYGSKMTIVKYTNYNNIIVQFDNGYRTKTNYGDYKKGAIKSPYDKTIYGVGYLGEGIYEVVHEYRQKTRMYIIWHHILERCYDPNYSNKKPTYEQCSVYDEWHNYQVFGHWYEENYYEIGNELICLDKDILVKGNKIYSPDTCIFVPKSINNGFVSTRDKKNGLPKGIKKHGNRYIARYTPYGKETNLGSFKTIEEAFNIYKMHREAYIKEIADKYKDKLPQKVYNALYNYKVEITD